MKHFALIMSAFYVLAGGVLVFTNLLGELIHSYRLPIGLLLIGYGVVRAYLWRRKFADPSEND